MDTTTLFAFSPAFLNGVVPFALYVLAGLIMASVFLTAYSLVTPYNEIQLLKQEGNTAVAWAFGGAFLGWAIPAAEAARGSVSLLDFMAWSAIAIVVQLLVLFLVRLVFPKMPQRIENNEAQAGMVVFFASVVVGLLNAASMSV